MQKNPANLIKTNFDQNKEIINTIKKVKNQQLKLNEKLESERNQLQLELNEIGNKINSSEMNIVEGIPSTALELESPDQELKSAVLQEFKIIDFKYKEKLKQLDDINTKNQIKYSEWTNEESEFFQHIYEQYHFHNISLNNCNLLLFKLNYSWSCFKFRTNLNIRILN